jgi:hypothetical protein
MTMRPFFFLLVFANLVFFAWAQGYFGAMDESREPERLAQQLQAEKLRILPTAPTPAAKIEATACQIINGLSAADAEALKSAPAAVGTELKILPPAESKIHLVAIVDLANQAVAERKAAELTRIKSARVDSRDAAPLKIRVEARAPASTLLRQLPLLIAPYGDATLAECEK